MAKITRRDFVNGTLVGAGAALLHANAPANAAKPISNGVVNDPWTGYGGVGDYAVSNGIAAGRWFEGFGNFFAIRRPMDTGELTQPFEPDKPTVMTFYVPFNNPDFILVKTARKHQEKSCGKAMVEFSLVILSSVDT